MQSTNTYKMDEMKEFLTDDQMIFLIEKVENGRKLEAARSLQYYLIDIVAISLPDAISIVDRLHAEFYA